tara:strand:- start:2466 stop:2648 length:183 start_codon:yes stop_codon:yes gene_type:complete
MYKHIYSIDMCLYGTKKFLNSVGRRGLVFAGIVVVVHAVGAGTYAPRAKKQMYPKRFGQV